MFAFRLAGVVALSALIAGLAGCAEMTREISRDSVKAPYVPTPMSYVDKMLALAEPRPDDVLYDLGSGDGRIPIRAVEKYDVKKSVGIDIDPTLVKLSNHNAEKAGVAERVVFRQADVFKANFREASIVTLYLLPEMNILLRPRLLNELKPGTRIVSHRFDFGDWKPDKSILAEDAVPRPINYSKTDLHHLMLFIVPAKASGLWRWSTGSGTGFSLHLEQKFQELGGWVDIGRGPVPIANGRMKGDRLNLKIRDREQGRDILVRFDGTVAGDTMRGIVDVNGQSVPFTAARVP